MGILEGKSRILDSILTTEGRRQLAEGTFNVSFATFTDTDMSYESDAVEGHVDPTDRIYFEASSLPQDQVIFEANDEGKIVGLRDKPTIIERSDLSLLPNKFSISLQNGKSYGYQINFGAKVQFTSLIPPKFSHTDIGFIFSDSSGKSARILLSGSKDVGWESLYDPIGTNPGVIEIGVKGGISVPDLTNNVQEAIASASLLSGKTWMPQVEVSDTENCIYITDVASLDEKIGLLVTTGSMFNLTSSNPPMSTFPISIEQAYVGGRKDLVEIPSSIFATDIAPEILAGAFDNYEQLRCLSTIDPIFLEDKFTLSTDTINFDLSAFHGALKNKISQVPTLNSIDSIFSDDRFSSFLNYKYLPPIVKTGDNILPDKTDINSIKDSGRLLGDYPELGDNSEKLTHIKLMNRLSSYQNYNLEFIETTRQNNLLCQIFEVNKLGEIKKLDIVDFGTSKDENTPSLLNNKVYFIGKTFLDDRGTACFLNIFSLIFSQTEGDEG